ncbi:MAG: PAS domain S-box protein [Alphaproteobacteria bacterium]|nr:PAS domain S-box protein [Alphaproteobacteria bacterium]
MNHQLIDLILVLLALAGFLGWMVQAYRHQVFEDRLRDRDDGEIRYQAMIEDQNDMICRWDANGTRTFVNEAYCQFYGKTAEQLVGTRIGNLMSEAVGEYFHQCLAGLNWNSPTFETEYSADRHDGAPRWLNWTNVGIFDSNGELVECHGVGRDVTERKETEIALRESEERFRALTSNSPQAVFLKDLDGKHLLVNEVFREWYGFDSDSDTEIIGKTAFDIMSSDEADQFVRHDMEVVQAVKTMEWEITHAFPDGVERVVHATKFPVFGPDGDIIAVGGINVDITGRKRTEEALRESEKRLRLFSDAMPALFSYVDKDRRYRFCNLAHEKHFRRKRNEIVGCTIDEINGPETCEQLRPVFDKVLSGENVFFEQWVDFREAGRTFIRGSLIPDISPGGEIEGFFAMTQDMTGKKRAEDRLARAKDKAEETSASKSRFLAAASHDLRQPMQAMAMFVDVLAGREHDRVSSGIIEKIQASSKSLQGLLNSLLDISKLDADLFIPEVRRFTIGELTSRLAEEIKPLAHKKGLRLIHVPSSLTVRSDPGLLDRILRNLLVNAVTNTEQGQILFGCRRRGRKLLVEVWDTGVGIPDDQKDKIFEEFYQGNEEGNFHTNGLGLGLTIVERLAKLLNHSVEVSSTPLAGSVFRVRVPIAKDGAPVADHTVGDGYEFEDSSGALIVGIDDDPSVRDALSLLLESWGFSAVTAASAHDAMQQLALENRAPDLVIADFQLQQGHKGSQAIRDIRQRWGNSIPGLLLTGDIEPVRLKEAVASGYQVIQKPVQPEKLKTAVAEKIDSGE